MTQLDSFLTVFFADISQSTQLFETEGNTRALEIVTHIIDALKILAEKHHGSIIKTIGDEVMCSFLETEDAVNAACAMQEYIHNDSFLAPYKVAIRIGFHTGNVLCSQGDIFGDGVNVASRAANLAHGGQIITTRDTLALLSDDMVLTTRFLGNIKIKEKDQKMNFHEILWSQESLDLTIGAASEFSVSRMGSSTLVLEYGGNRTEVGLLRTLVLLGRGEQNDVVVANKYVSKRHASLELRDAEFVLSDHSVNGTYIRKKDCKDVRIQRNETVLTGKGLISLGRPFDEEDADPIGFRVK